VARFGSGRWCGNVLLTGLEGAEPRPEVGKKVGGGVEARGGDEGRWDMR
jgi:hypothetical protein